jgi:hypothetical protein
MSTRTDFFLACKTLNLLVDAAMELSVLILSLLVQDVLMPVLVASEGFRALFPTSAFFSVVRLDPVVYRIFG